MFKNGLLYLWGANLEPALSAHIETLCGHYTTCSTKIKDHSRDVMLAQELIEQIHKDKNDFIFTYDYIPILSMVAEATSIPYISWIYDCPHYTAMSPTVRNNNTYIFCFDKELTKLIGGLGASHIYHYPLGSEVNHYQNIIGKDIQSHHTQSDTLGFPDVSFVGNLYNSEKNLFELEGLSSYSKGYLQGLVNAQRSVWGQTFIEESLPADIIDEILSIRNIRVSGAYELSDSYLVACALENNISGFDRYDMLKAAASVSNVDLYCSKEVPETLIQLPTLKVHSSIAHLTQMPIVFNRSKINLNITLRSIKSGISLRVIDIMACGGFCLTNYQPELSEYFDIGRELVVYSDIRELKEIIPYYLSHENERKTISQAGFSKVKEFFNSHDCIKEILNMVHTDFNSK